MNNDRLKRHEGFRKYIYLCSAGKRTIGYGLNLDAGILEEEASLLLDFRVNKIVEDFSKRFSFWDKLSETRKEVLVNMAYNIGIEGLLAFKNTLKLIKEGRYGEASIEMLNSKWATQVPNRARELSEMMRGG